MTMGYWKQPASIRKGDMSRTGLLFDVLFRALGRIVDAVFVIAIDVITLPICLLLAIVRPEYFEQYKNHENQT